MKSYYPDYSICCDSRKIIKKGLCVHMGKEYQCCLHNNLKCMCWTDYIPTHCEEI
jgi:hypothetical protein